MITLRIYVTDQRVLASPNINNHNGPDISPMLFVCVLILNNHNVPLRVWNPWQCTFASTATWFLTAIHVPVPLGGLLGSDHLTSGGRGEGGWSGWNIFFTCFQRQKTIFSTIEGWDFFFQCMMREVFFYCTVLMNNYMY